MMAVLFPWILSLDFKCFPSLPWGQQSVLVFLRGQEALCGLLERL